MLRRLWRDLVRGEDALVAAPVPAETLNLDDAPSLRMIVPHREGTYAALVNSVHGLVIINRNDAGVGWQLATRGAYDTPQMGVLESLARAVPAGAVVLDIGANIGITALILARIIGPAGLVHAFEPQRPMFHMLAGNLALNGIENVHCHYLAVGNAPGEARIPRLDYHAGANFGGVELNREQQSDAQQQAVGGQFDAVPLTSIDALELQRVDLIKIDVEGMEADVLAGAIRTIAACKPLMYVEYLKSGKQPLGQILGDAGYALYDVGGNFVCIPADHPRLTELSAGWERFEAAASDAGGAIARAAAARMPFLEHYDDIYAPLLERRAAGFRAIFEALEKRCKASGAPALIVETGSMRELHNWLGDGQSTYLWNDFAAFYKSEIHTVDLDPQAAAVVHENCPAVQAHTGDSVAWLHEFARTNRSRHIDVLYLDSYDVDMEDPFPSAFHHVKEMLAAGSCLGPGTIIAVDDNHHQPDGAITGKGYLLIKWFEHLNIPCLHAGYQYVWQL